MLENLNDVLSLIVLALCPLYLVWLLIKVLLVKLFGELDEEEEQIDYYKEW